MKKINLVNVAITLCCAFLSSSIFAANNDGQWVASWGSSPYTFQAFGGGTQPAPFNNQTVRQVIRLSVGGDQVSVRFSNENGTEPLVIGKASIAFVDSGSAVTGSIKMLSFGGQQGIEIPPGAPAVSDPIDFEVEALEELAISIYLPESTSQSTMHSGRIAFISNNGDFTQTRNLSNAEQTTNLVFLSAVNVKRTEKTKVVVAFGDSITDGTASTPYTFNSWPDHFAERLINSGHTNIAVVNQGIAGNQVLRNGAGDSALGRFDQDVFSTPGLTHIVIMEGINDIGTGGFAFGGGEAPPLRTAAEIVAGYQQLITRAHTQSPPVKIYGATLTPFEGTFAGYYSPEKDLIRHEVNEWIRTSGMFDAVIDFDLAIQDPENTNIMKAEYNSGDSLHPGDAGYKRMAEFIDIGLFE